MIPPLVDSLKFMTPLNYDAITYLLIEQLSDPREKFKVCAYLRAGFLTSDE